MPATTASFRALRAAQLALLAMLVMLPNILFVHQIPYLGSEIQTFLMIVFVAVLALTVVASLTRSSESISIERSELVLLFFFVAVIASFLPVADYRASLATVIGWFEALCLFFIVKSVLRGEKTRVIFFWLLVLYGSIFAVCFGLQMLKVIDPDAKAVFLPFALNRNYVAQLLVVPLFCALALLGGKSVWQRFAAGLLGVVPIFIGIALTRSRAVWLGLACTIFAWVLSVAVKKWNNRTNRTRKSTWRLILIAILVAGSALVAMHYVLPNYGLPSPLETIETLSSPTEGSAGGRLRRWYNAMPMVRDHLLLGVGPGNWVSEFHRYRSDPVQDAPGFPLAFNSFLELLGESGIFAFLSFVIWCATLLWARDNRNHTWNMMSLGFLVLIVAAFFHTTFSIRVLLFNFMLCAALLAVTRKSDPKPVSWKVSKRTAAIGFGVLLVAAVPLEWKYLSAKLHYMFIANSETLGSTHSLKRKGGLYPYLPYIKEKYFSAADYRSHHDQIIEVARWGSGNQRNLYFVIGAKEYRDKRRDSALEWLTLAREKMPYDPRVILSLCDCQRTLGWPEDALQTCLYGVNFHEYDADLRELTGRLQKLLGLPEEARKNFERAIELIDRKLESDPFGKRAKRRVSQLTAQKNAIQNTLPRMDADVPTRPFKRDNELLKRITDTPSIHKRFEVVDGELFFSTNQSGRYELWRQRPGQAAQQVSDDEHVYFRLTALPGRNRLYFLSDRAGNNRYDLLAISGFPNKVLTSKHLF